MFVKDEMLNLVDPNRVNDKDTLLEKYSSDLSFMNKVKPSLIIDVKNTEDIQRIVKMANETKTPLIPISSGPPHFRGDTVPSVAEAVVVNLSGMKKIIRVDMGF